MSQFDAVFFEKKDYRKNQLFSLLHHNLGEGMYIKNLIIQSNVSSKTFYSDLKELQEDILEVYGFQLLISEGVGKVGLDYGKSFSWQKLKMFYAERGRNFWVFHKIVHQPSYLHRKKKINFYFSNSSVYASMAQLNEKFKDLNIMFSLAGVKGDEKKIRLLLFESYWSLFKGYSWPFESERQVLLQEVQKMENAGMKFNEVEKEKILYWFAITEIRLKRGAFIKKNTESQSQSSMKNTIVKDVFKKKLGRDIPSQFWGNEVFFLIKTLSNFIGYSSPSTIKIKSKKYSDEVVELEKLLKLKIDGSYQSSLIDSLLKKTRYYVEENLIDLYHFMEPEADRYFVEYQKSLDVEVDELFKKLPENICSMYFYECKNNGISLLRTIRIQIISSEGYVQQIVNLLKNYSQYPIEFVQMGDINSDIILTNYPLEENMNKYVYYNWPITENTIGFIWNSIKKAVTHLTD